MNILSLPFVLHYANDNDALVPEVWAQEALITLEENMLAAGLVHRDFSNDVAAFGDTVNAHRPQEFQAQRKTQADEVTVQDAKTTNVPVVLNQHVHSSFMIYDEERSKAMKDLIGTHLVPAVRSCARFLDQMVLAQTYQFMGNAVGKLGTDPTKDSLIDLETKFDELKIPLDSRYCVVNHNTKGAILKDDNFTAADKLADGGRAIREGSLGRLLSVNYLMAQNTPHVTSQTKVTGAVNNAGGYGIGDTSITIDNISGTLTAGSWCTIAGDMTPQKITATTESGSDTTGITISPGLNSAVADDAVLTVYTPGAINNSGGYALNYAKALTVDGISTNVPKAGQLVSFDTAGGIETFANTEKYGLVGAPSLTSLTLDNVLSEAVADDDIVGLGPEGTFNFAFHPNAVALVMRPLAPAPSEMGARSFTASYNNASIRVTMTYNGNKQGTLVTVDFLAGIKVLDSNLGICFYA